MLMSIKPNGRGLINQTEDRMKRLKEPRDKGFIYQVEFDAQLERILAAASGLPRRLTRGLNATCRRQTKSEDTVSS